jgi:hypothetical protein
MWLRLSADALSRIARSYGHITFSPCSHMWTFLLLVGGALLLSTYQSSAASLTKSLFWIVSELL